MLKKVEVVWNDAWGNEGTVSIEDIQHVPYLTHSIGYLLNEDENGVTIAMDCYPADASSVRNYAFIPIDMIVLVNRL